MLIGEVSQWRSTKANSMDRTNQRAPNGDVKTHKRISITVNPPTASRRLPWEKPSSNIITNCGNERVEPIIKRGVVFYSFNTSTVTHVHAQRVAKERCWEQGKHWFCGLTSGAAGDLVYRMINAPTAISTGPKKIFSPWVVSRSNCIERTLHNASESYRE
ncbi:hypothetical protein HZH66_007608 [Vespula vulgaris]|uniref:Uncharacterized protein n=1 Tax=Vespula vulgaris TaxID=7454 RepID=A0A834K061_VESVU|nr:hypothetical protein HZH66_007608 [Vespula vulgaris]